MSVRLRTILSDLKAKGITANDLTADELEMLVHAVDRANNPYRGLNARLVGKPVRVAGELYIWPVTLGAKIWLTEYAERWWKRGTMMHTWATVYALHHARDPEAFTCLETRGCARFAIMRTMLRFCVHEAELRDAIARCNGIHRLDAPRKAKAKTRPDEQVVGFSRFAAELEAGTGIAVKTWLWGKSLDETIDAWRTMKTLSRAAHGGKASGDDDADLNDALENLAAAISAIVTARVKKD